MVFNNKIIFLETVKILNAFKLMKTKCLSVKFFSKTKYIKRPSTIFFKKMN